MITQMMQDPDIRVKDTSAWTLGRVSELHPECIKSEQSLNLLMTALLRGLEDTPRVSSNCCWAIMNMSDRLGDEERGVQTYPLSPYFEYICVNLIKTATRYLFRFVFLFF